MTMKRILAASLCSVSLAGCAGTMPSFEMPGFSSFGGSGPQTVQLESQPPGAEARLSNGQACRTPCAMEAPANEFSVAFSLPGHQPRTVPVRMSASDPNTGRPQLAPNPVYVDLSPAASPAPPRRRAVPSQSQARPVASNTSAPAPRKVTTASVPAPLAPQPASAQAWPPPSR